ncbi:hypothetical protein LPW26_12185 [Rhodopseudomonas sp. HC1]|uniref:hypothetical protein n=1 Tax=Rhodopseudomonas infernalis TaxID=2897386 RepID=UPI001EE8B88D|nr:hypothetical protein [Rhodopseudomonas infernalis]MCG6205401.1 hypothetical protein [Rhodopseudomonas infernalis]
MGLMTSGWAIVGGLAAAMTAASAQPVPRIAGAPVVTQISDIDEPYAAVPPPRLRRVIPDDDGYAPEVLSPREVADLARDAGFEPLGVPYQRGLVYTMSALNPDGDDGRLVVDARSGRILRFMPAWQMGDAMETMTVASYGRIQGLPRFIERNPPRPPRAVGRLASRTPTTPLPRPSPQQSTRGPSPAAASNAATAVAPVKDATKPATDAAKVEPGKTEPTKIEAPAKQEAAAAQTKPTAPPAPAPTEAKPAPAGPTVQPTEPMPPVQGLE